MQRFLVLGGLACTWLAGRALAGEPAPSPPREIRQGGYVEKVEPGVDYKDRLPQIPPREPGEALKSFHLIPGFRIELAAAEPLVCDPVDLCFDEQGRMFVAEMIPYAEGNSSAPGSPGGRVSRLEDTDGDGRFDRRTVYVDKLVWPTGVACFDGGVFIAAAPELLYCKDTNGDGRADVREVVLTGFSTSNPNALPGSLRFRPDCRLHGMTSTSGGVLEPVKWNAGAGEGDPAEPVQARGRDFSVHPRTGELRLESGGAQFGMTFDAWGRKFESSNSTPIEMVMADDRYLGRNPYLAPPSPRVRIGKYGNTVFRTSPLEPWRVVRTEMRVRGVFSGPVEGGGKPAGYFTAACGLMVYQGDAWPEEFRGNAFVCEGAGNLVHRMRLEPDGVGMAAFRTEEDREFLTSDDIWFKPVQLANGPDGNLYVADMYREVFEHPDAVPPSVKKYVDLTRGSDRGRIYRIVHEGFQRPKPPRLGDLSTEELVALLGHPNGWHRETAARLLYERQDRTAVEPLLKLAVESPNALARMHAMYALSGMDALPVEVLPPRITDEHPRVREHAVRLSEPFLAQAPAVRELLYAAADDADARVRYQLAFTLGEIPGPRATAALARIAARDVADNWVRVAVLSSCHGRAGELLSTLCEDSSWRATPAARGFLEELAEQAGLAGRRDQVAAVLSSLEALPPDEKALSESITRGLSRGLKRSGSPLLEQLAGGERAAAVLAAMIERAAEAAVDEDAPVESRVEAAALLSLAPFDVARRVLPDLLEGRQPAELQMAALRSLGHFRGAEVAEMIVDAWGGFSPNVRDAAAEALFARQERLGVLLDAVQHGLITPSQLDPARIQFLVAHPNAELAARAKELLGDVKLARREDAVAAYRDVLDMKGDVAAGREVFKRECAKCHRLEGVGYDLGLPLATVKSRGREGVLVQILDPNREVNPAYLNYTVLTDDGLTVTGMIAAETPTSIELRRSEEESDTVLRAEIDVMESSGLSIMPEGLEKQITKREMADLLEYLMTVQ